MFGIFVHAHEQGDSPWFPNAYVFHLRAFLKRKTGLPFKSLRDFSIWLPINLAHPGEKFKFRQVHAEIPLFVSKTSTFNLRG
jgi:hypothetical protein